MAEIVEITSDRDRVDLNVVYGFLKDAYWCRGVPREVVERSVRNSLCFSAFADGSQVGFARVISDGATFAYLADVFVLPEHRARGIGKRLLRAVLGEPSLQGLRRILLATRDAHGLYAQHGFRALNAPDMFMEIHVPGIYERAGCEP